MTLQQSITLTIIGASRVMDVAVHFDNERGGVALEIDDKACDDLLTAEVKPINLVIPHRLLVAV